MKTLKLFTGLLAVSLLTVSCTGKKNGDQFVGTWRAEGDKAPKEGFYVSDRLIIEKSGEAYNASLLAQGVFTTMTFNQETGFLCTEKGECFEMKNQDTLRVGSTNGIKQYNREK